MDATSDVRVPEKNVSSAMIPGGGIKGSPLWIRHVQRAMLRTPSGPRNGYQWHCIPILVDKYFDNLKGLAYQRMTATKGMTAKMARTHVWKAVATRAQSGSVRGAAVLAAATLLSLVKEDWAPGFTVVDAVRIDAMVKQRITSPTEEVSIEMMPFLEYLGDLLSATLNVFVACEGKHLHGARVRVASAKLCQLPQDRTKAAHVTAAASYLVSASMEEISGHLDDLILHGKAGTGVDAWVKVRVRKLGTGKAAEAKKAATASQPPAWSVHDALLGSVGFPSPDAEGGGVVAGLGHSSTEPAGAGDRVEVGEPRSQHESLAPRGAPAERVKKVTARSGAPQRRIPIHLEWPPFRPVPLDHQAFPPTLPRSPDVESVEHESGKKRTWSSSSSGPIDSSEVDKACVSPQRDHSHLTPLEVLLGVVDNAPAPKKQRAQPLSVRSDDADGPLCGRGSALARDEETNAKTPPTTTPADVGPASNCGRVYPADATGREPRGSLRGASGPFLPTQGEGVDSGDNA